MFRELGKDTAGGEEMKEEELGLGHSRKRMGTGAREE